MSTETASTVAPVVGDPTERRLDLHSRYLRAGLADPALLDDIPRGVTFLLLPDDDPVFVEHEIALAVDAARQGKDVYLRHVRVADLPPSQPPRGTRPGDRRVTYAEDGAITANLVFGDDGQWHETDEPPPGPRDDEPWTDLTNRDAPKAG